MRVENVGSPGLVWMSRENRDCSKGGERGIGPESDLGQEMLDPVVGEREIVGCERAGAIVAELGRGLFAGGLFQPELCGGAE